MKSYAVAIITCLLASAAWAGPPPKSEPPNRRPPAIPEPAVELHVDGSHLTYTYDIAGIFDANLWRVLQRHGENEISVEVRLRDRKDRIRFTHFHRLRLIVYPNGGVRMVTGPERQKLYQSRAALQTALRRVPGTPIPAKDFRGEQGSLEIVVMVNPVVVYSFPDEDAPVADRKVTPRQVFDRRHMGRRPTVVP